MNLEEFTVENGGFSLKDFERKIISKSEDDKLKDEVYEKELPVLVDLHEKLNAEGTRGIVVVLQALDAAGKDEVVKYIFSNLLVQGLKHTSFGKPTDEENNHDYLWRMQKAMPERGQIGILNRSYYEDVISPKIYDILEEEPLPDDLIGDDIWEMRYSQIKNFEKYLKDNGFPVVKFFFHMSKDKQKERLLERLENPNKNHEFSFSDLDDRKHWDDYQEVFEDMLNNTSTKENPWYILPADNPWASRLIATKALIKVLKDIDPKFPEFSDEEKKKVKEAIEKLKNDEI